ncbi:hypothetical protein BU23DRAFT_213669 [Bimuria novae-zelandiae CBS 107.79]|uniref:Uncharacterized protein n=1 Tax=Bimuria novae-zelandiae CBS 107.79 TaxID=1447943 RepID=A0A6A5V2L1_9PLEO|nr:hypothetical protein BU23DRAFT_213669 [Bimuria novae-zelandiae CBS 107.79]
MPRLPLQPRWIEHSTHALALIQMHSIHNITLHCTSPQQANSPRMRKTRLTCR